MKYSVFNCCSKSQREEKKQNEFSMMERAGFPWLPVDGRREATGTAGVDSLRIVGYGDALQEQQDIEILVNVIQMLFSC